MKLKATPLYLLAPVMILFVLTGCHPAKKSYQSGDFESAIEKAVRKLKNDPSDEENITYLEAAYDKLYYQITDRVSFLRKEGRPENVLTIFDEMSRLKLYEGMIRPLLPLQYSTKNRTAQFRFIADEDFIAAKQAAAEYLYVYAGKLLAANNRIDARRAYELYEELKCIYPTYKDTDAKQKESLIKGTNQVNLQIINNSGAPLFTELEKQITTISTGDLNATWVNFSTEKNSKRQFDYRVAMNIRYVFVTPDLQLVSTTYTDKKTIADGWEYELDSNGNVMKDSLGNDIKKTKYKSITCIVTEYIQQKKSTISGSIEFFKTTGNSLLYSYPVDVNKIFEHHWATATGDLRALSQQSAEKVKAGPVTFPSEVDMLLMVSDDLKMNLKRAVNDHMGLLSN